MKLRQFTLRELLWIVLIAAILCGWWLDHFQLQRQLKALQFNELTD